MAIKTQSISTAIRRHSLSDLTIMDYFAALCAAVSALLFSLNLYGEVKTMRVVDNVPADHFLFDNDITLEVDETLAQIKKLPYETDLDFSIRLTTVVQQSLGHLKTWHSASPDDYPQRVPLRENIWLHMVSHLVTDPEVVKYHFADYRRTLERGIAICGDHSYMVSQILWDNDIPNSILVFQPHEDYFDIGGHVAVEVRPENGRPHILDADFGVVFPVSKESIETGREMIKRTFLDAGYDDRRSTMLATIMSGRFVEWENTWDIMKKRYAFEKVSYVVKWLVPVLLLTIFLCSRVRRTFIEFE